MLTIIEIIEDHGSVVTFGTEEGPTVTVDHGPARDIAIALEYGDLVEVDPEGWQLGFCLD